MTKRCWAEPESEAGAQAPIYFKAKMKKTIGVHGYAPSQRESLLLNLAAQTVICFAMVHTVIQRGSLPGPFLLATPLLFSLLLWRMQTDNAWRSHRYLVVQSVVAFLSLTQEFPFVYLYFILAGEAMLLFKVRTGLIWNSIFLFLALFGNSYFHPQGALDPASRASLIIAGVILSTFMSSGIARARRDRNEINSLLAQLSEAHTRLQAHTQQAELLAASEERNRLARDLNHTLGHMMTVAIVQVEGAALLLEKEPGRVAAHLKTVHEQLTAGLNELRRITKRIRSSNGEVGDPTLVHRGSK